MFLGVKKLKEKDVLVNENEYDDEGHYILVTTKRFDYHKIFMSNCLVFI